MFLVSGIYNILGLQWNLVFSSTLWCREFNIPTHLWLQWLSSALVQASMTSSLLYACKCSTAWTVPSFAASSTCSLSPPSRASVSTSVCLQGWSGESTFLGTLFFWNNIAQRLCAISNSAFKWICLVTPWRSPWMRPCLRLSCVPQH